MRVQMTKTTVRVEIKKLLKAMTYENRRSQSAYILKTLMGLEEFQNSKRVGIYLNLPEEVQTTNMVQHLFDCRKECFIPRYNAEEMVMVKLKSMEDLDSLPKTKWNIKQPLESEEREDSFLKGGLDLIVVPGLAFTEVGERLGRGKGYYDKFLAKMDNMRKSHNKKMSTIGVCYREQIQQTLPTDINDYKLDRILFQK